MARCASTGKLCASGWGREGEVGVDAEVEERRHGEGNRERERGEKFLGRWGRGLGDGA